MGDLNLDWRWILARGLLSILFGVLVLLFPAKALVTVALLFAIYVVAGGALALSAAWQMRDQKGRGLLVFEGVIGVLAGILAIFYPGAALFALILLISAWALIAGAVELYVAIAYRKVLTHSVLLGVAGAVSILFGLIVMFRPAAGTLALLTMLAFYAIFFGLFLTLWSLRLKQHKPISVEARAT